jgi:hypothetical protein
VAIIHSISIVAAPENIFKRNYMEERMFLFDILQSPEIEMFLSEDLNAKRRNTYGREKRGENSRKYGQ